MVAAGLAYLLNGHTETGQNKGQNVGQATECIIMKLWDW